jgi:biopolymer transport protein ExbB
MNSAIELFQHGGLMMYPLLICSVILIAIVIERVIVIRKNTSDAEDLLDEIRKLYQPGGDPAKAIEAVGNEGSIGRVFARGLKNSSRSADAIEMAMEQEASNETPTLEANLPIIRTIVNIAPLLGLLGTIAGMIAAFRSVGAQGLGNPTGLLSGLSEALVSTATGISLAVVAFITYNYFANVSKKTIEDIEYYGAELVNYMTGRID